MINPPSNGDASGPPRRRFLGRSIALVGSSALTKQVTEANPPPAPPATHQPAAVPPAKPTAPAGPAKLKAAIIGHTGRGGFGHGLDELFNGRADVELIAISDGDPAGLAKSTAKLKPERSYAQFRELLERERPNLVCIAPRHADQHHAMALAALKAGAHLFIERPFTTDLIEADEVLAEAERAEAKITVAMQMRLSPNLAHLAQVLKGGLIGDLLEIRAWGKQDQRAGGEDLVVCGAHQFDLFRLFAGEPLWCAARITQEGRDITTADARVPADNVGPVAGDEICAHFAFPNGVNATWHSRRRLREPYGNWAIELHGTEGAARINCNVPPSVFTLRRGSWSEDGRPDKWEPLATDPMRREQPGRNAGAEANARLYDDWMDSIRKNREPVCNGGNAMKAMEMVMAVFRAGLSGQRVHFPLEDRRHPLKQG